MIIYYRLHQGALVREETPPGARIPEDILWIDLLHPTQEEEFFVEQQLGVGIPTREEMAEIEESSRFYQQGDTLYMTPRVVKGIEEEQPELTDMFFVFTGQRLVTVHYTETVAFRSFSQRIARQPDLHRTSDMLLIALVDGFIDRIADVLEDQQHQLDRLSRRIFNPDSQPGEERTDLQRILRHLGQHHALLAKLDDSLLSFTRLASYLRQGSRLSGPARNWLKAISRDISSLSEYQARMSSQITFQLDATLGMINIEQNAIIKVFSIAAVLFLPPTLVGTVYGMNFHHMPELDWIWGYPIALALMGLSALLSLVFFRYKGWW